VLWTPTLHWRSSCKRKSSAEQLASSSPGSRANSSNSNSKVNAVLVKQGTSCLAADHHSQEMALMGDRPVADLQSPECSHMPTPSCSDSSAREGPSRHSSSSSSSQKRSPPSAARLPSSLVGTQKSKQSFGVTQSHGFSVTSPQCGHIGQQYCNAFMLGVLGPNVPRITPLHCDLEICN